MQIRDAQMPASLAHVLFAGHKQAAELEDSLETKICYYIHLHDTQNDYFKLTKSIDGKH